MKQEKINVEELFDKNICLLKIAIDYCSSNQKSIQSLFDTMELNNKNL